MTTNKSVRRSNCATGNSDLLRFM